MPDLDNLISQAFAYAYRLTGERHRTERSRIDLFNTSVESGLPSMHKHYNQQFRSSGHLPGYLAGPVTFPPNAPLTLRVVR